jgi:hypothetical protein
MTLDFDKLMYPHLRHPRNDARREAYDLERMGKVYRDVFLSDQGKVVLADIAQRGLLHTVSFTGETPFSTAFNEGKRALALEIIRLLNPNPINTRGGNPDDRTTQFGFDTRVCD